MELYWNCIVFVFGAIIGSFLNVVIYRFHTGKSINGHSHCMSCGRKLEWYELLPIVSLVMLKAHCRTCKARIPYRYLFVEVLTASAFLFVWLLYSFDLVLVVFNWFIVAILILIVVYDLRHMVIPDELVGILLVAVLGVVTYTATVGGGHPEAILSHIGAGLLGGAFFASFWLVSKGRWMGLGDAKLMVPLGILLGAWGTLEAIILAFWIGAAVSVSLLLIQRALRAGTTRVSFLGTPLKIKSEIPFAPFLVIGFSLVHFFHVDLFQAFPLIYPF